MRSLGEIIGELGRRAAGGSTFKGRVMRGAGYLGAGYGAAGLIQHQADIKRNYYGQERYDQYYGSGAETLSGIAKGAGMWYGAFALLGRDPIARTINSAKYYKAKIASTKWSDIWEQPLGLPRTKASAYTSSDIKKLSQNPRVGPLQAMAWASMAGAPEVGAVIGMGMMGTGIMGSMGRMRGGRGAPTGVGFAATPGKWGARLSSMGTGAAVMGAGGYLGYMGAQRPDNVTAEGTIRSFDRYNSAGVSRMNYSTAGLVQALHRNNRKF